jgi:hypothetical protein
MIGAWAFDETTGSYKPSEYPSRQVFVPAGRLKFITKTYAPECIILSPHGPTGTVINNANDPNWTAVSTGSNGWTVTQSGYGVYRFVPTNNTEYKAIWVASGVFTPGFDLNATGHWCRTFWIANHGAHSVTSFSGLGILLSTAPSGGPQGYFITPGTSVVKLYRVNNSGTPTAVELASFATTNTWDAVTDWLQVEARIVGGNPVLTVWDTGKYLGSYTDTDASKLTTGSPGFVSTNNVSPYSRFAAGNKATPGLVYETTLVPTGDTFTLTDAGGVDGALDEKLYVNEENHAYGNGFNGTSKSMTLADSATEVLGLGGTDEKLDFTVVRGRVKYGTNKTLKYGRVT